MMFLIIAKVSTELCLRELVYLSGKVGIVFLFGCLSLILSVNFEILFTGFCVSSSMSILLNILLL